MPNRSLLVSPRWGLLVLFFALSLPALPQHVEDGPFLETESIGGCQRGGRPGANRVPEEIPQPDRTIPATPVPEATEGIALQIAKTWDSPNAKWVLTLSWVGAASPVIISYSTDPSFQVGNRSLAMNFTPSIFSANANSSAPLECFAVTDDTTVSPAVRGQGYDPAPAPSSPIILQDGLWWGDALSLQSDYLHLMPEGNFLGLAARAVKASATVDGGAGFASQASFQIPDDGRGAYGYVVAHHGQYPQTGTPFIHLYPRGIPAYSSIRAIVWAPTTGHIWVAADSKVEEIDLFQHDPAIVRSITTYAKPYISQCTTGGMILIVDGVLGVSTIDQIDTSTGTITAYASTSDTSHTPPFTRAVLPRGIAVDPDGSAAYLADAAGGATHSTPVRFPAGNGAAITDSYGNWPYWSFPDPCGIEIGITHKLYAGDSRSLIRYVTAPGSSPQTTQTYTSQSTSASPLALLVDRDVSTVSTDRYFWNDTPWTMAYNKNNIASVSGRTPAQHLGADIIAINGRLSVEPQWEYTVAGNAPKPVILSNSGINHPYPSSYQVGDRIVQLSVRGWIGVPIHLRLIDPPDIAPYAPVGGWPAKGTQTANPPYEANDNDVWADSASTDWGLSSVFPGTLAGPILDLTVTPGSGNTATFYLKLPPRYAGDNWQVEITKRSATGGTIADKVPSLSSMFVGWKRTWIEKDYMFRRGGLLRMDAAPGQSHILLYKNLDDTRWDNLHEGDKVILFDQSSILQFPPWFSHEVAYVAQGGIDDSFPPAAPGEPHQVRVSLVTTRNGATPYSILRGYQHAPPGPGFWPDFPTLGTPCASVGVIDSQVLNELGQVVDDTDLNNLNGPGSAFFQVDLRNTKELFDDAFLEVFARWPGQGAIPFMSKDWFDFCTGSGILGSSMMSGFSRLWFINKSLQGVPPTYTPNSYFHFLGANDCGLQSGGSWYLDNWSFVYQHQFDLGYSSPTDRRCASQAVWGHEGCHQFDVNPSSSCQHHDSNNAWCDAPGHCGSGGTTPIHCLMNLDGTLEEFRQQLADGIDRLDLDNLATGVEVYAGSIDCGVPQPWAANDGTIRTAVDPQ